MSNEQVKKSARSVKDRVKEKMQSAKDRIKEKVKGRAKASLAVAALCAALAGCMDTAPASRYTATTIGDVTVKNSVDNFKNKPGPWATNAVPIASSPLVAISTTIRFNDMTMASADSAGSTETQTATPTLDVRTRVDARYNDAVSAASEASRKVLDAIADGRTQVEDMMQSGETGETKVTKTDGSIATVKVANGQCEFADGKEASK